MAWINYSIIKLALSQTSSNNWSLFTTNITERRARRNRKCKKFTCSCTRAKIAMLISRYKISLGDWKSTSNSQNRPPFKILQTTLSFWAPPTIPPPTLWPSQNSMNTPPSWKGNRKCAPSRRLRRMMEATAIYLVNYPDRNIESCRTL